MLPWLRLKRITADLRGGRKCRMDAALRIASRGIPRSDSAVGRLLGVEDDVKEQQASGGEDDVVAGQHLDP